MNLKVAALSPAKKHGNFIQNENDRNDSSILFFLYDQDVVEVFGRAFVDNSGALLSRKLCEIRANTLLRELNSIQHVVHCILEDSPFLVIVCFDKIRSNYRVFWYDVLANTHQELQIGLSGRIINSVGIGRRPSHLSLHDMRFILAFGMEDGSVRIISIKINADRNCSVSAQETVAVVDSSRSPITAIEVVSPSFENIHPRYRHPKIVMGSMTGALVLFNIRVEERRLVIMSKRILTREGSIHRGRPITHLQSGRVRLSTFLAIGQDGSRNRADSDEDGSKHSTVRVLRYHANGRLAVINTIRPKDPLRICEIAAVRVYQTPGGLISGVIFREISRPYSLSIEKAMCENRSENSRLSSNRPFSPTGVLDFLEVNNECLLLLEQELDKTKTAQNDPDIIRAVVNAGAISEMGGNSDSSTEALNASSIGEWSAVSVIKDSERPISDTEHPQAKDSTKVIKELTTEKGEEIAYIQDIAIDECGANGDSAGSVVDDIEEYKCIACNEIADGGIMGTAIAERVVTSDRTSNHGIVDNVIADNNITDELNAGDGGRDRDITNTSTAGGKTKSVKMDTSALDLDFTNDGIADKDTPDIDIRDDIILGDGGRDYDIADNKIADTDVTGAEIADIGTARVDIIDADIVDVDIVDNPASDDDTPANGTSYNGLPDDTITGDDISDDSVADDDLSRDGVERRSRDEEGGTGDMAIDHDIYEYDMGDNDDIYYNNKDDLYLDQTSVENMVDICDEHHTTPTPFASAPDVIASPRKIPVWQLVDLLSILRESSVDNELFIDLLLSEACSQYQADTTYLHAHGDSILSELAKGTLLNQRSHRQALYYLCLLDVDCQLDAASFMFMEEEDKNLVNAYMQFDQGCWEDALNSLATVDIASIPHLLKILRTLEKHAGADYVNAFIQAHAITQRAPTACISYLQRHSLEEALRYVETLPRAERQQCLRIVLDNICHGEEQPTLKDIIQLATYPSSEDDLRQFVSFTLRSNSTASKLILMHMYAFQHEYGKAVSTIRLLRKTSNSDDMVTYACDTLEASIKDKQPAIMAYLPEDIFMRDPGSASRDYEGFFPAHGLAAGPLLFGGAFNNIMRREKVKETGDESLQQECTKHDV